MRYLHIIEDGSNDKWYLTIGRNAPWNNPGFRMPELVAVALLRLRIAR